MLVISVTQIAHNAIGAAYETTMLVRLGAVYGKEGVGVRIAFRPLVVDAVTRGGPALILATGLLIFGAGIISPDIELASLAILSAPLGAGLIFQIATTSLTAHLYASRRLPSVYIGNAFLGGPSIICALFWHEPLIIALVYAIGQAARGLFLLWRVHVSQKGVPHTQKECVAPPTWQELSPQIVSSSAGQAMPLLVQVLLAGLGAQAIAIGAIALRVWGAGWQVGVSTVAMPETVTLTRTLPTLSPVDREQWLARRALRLLVATCALTAIGVAVVSIGAALGAEVLTPSISSGLLWSIAALLGLPGGLLGFWAGRGLVTVGAARWLPVMIAIAFAVGALVCTVLLPLFGGLGVLVSQAVAFTAQGLGIYVVLRKKAASG